MNKPELVKIGQRVLAIMTILLAGCQPTVYDVSGEVYEQPTNETDFYAPFGKQVGNRYIKLTCDYGRTKDNEGCMQGAEKFSGIPQNPGEVIQTGDYWIVKAYGKDQVRIVWSPSSEQIKASDFHREEQYIEVSEFKQP